MVVHYALKMVQWWNVHPFTASPALRVRNQASGLGIEPRSRPVSKVNRMPFSLCYRGTKRSNCSPRRLTVHSGGRGWVW